MPNVSFMGPTDFTAEQADIDRRRKYAEALRQQSMQPLETQTAGGWAIPISPTQGIAKLLSAYVGKKGETRATEDTKALATRKNQALVEALGGMPRARTETQPLPYANDDEGNAMPAAQRTVQPTMQDNAQWLGSLAKIGPDAVQMGTGVLGMQQKADLANATREQTAADRQAARQQQMALLEMRMQDARTTAQDRAQLQRELAQMRMDAQREMVQMRGDMKASGGQPYFTPVQTAQGVMAFNARTGRMEPIQVGGAPVVGSQSDPTLQGKVAEAKAGGKERGEGVAKTQMGLPQAVATAEQQLGLIDQMVGDKGVQLPPGQQPRAAHPGFETTVGATLLPGARFVPGTESANFKAILDQVKGGAFLQAYQSLRGGGQITEVEGKKATDAITRMNIAQSEAEFVKAAREFQSVIRAGVDRAKRASGGNFAVQPPAAPAAEGWGIQRLP